MKKILSLILLALLVVGLFAGCGKATDGTDGTASKADKTASETEETPETVTVWLVTERARNSTGDVTTFKYDENGRMIEEKNKTSCSEITCIYTYKYDDNDNVIEKRASLKSGVNVINYEYNSKEQLIKEKQYYDNGDLHQDIDYKYNAQGYLSEIVNAYKSGSVHKTTFTYDENGNLIEEITDLGYRASKHVSTYDENNRLTKTTLWDKDLGEEFEEYGVTEYKYDEKGNMIEEVLDYEIVIYYKYDENNNIIECDGSTFKYTSIQVSAKRAAEIKKEQDAIEKIYW